MEGTCGSVFTVQLFPSMQRISSALSASPAVVCGDINTNPEEINNSGGSFWAGVEGLVGDTVKAAEALF